MSEPKDTQKGSPRSEATERQPATETKRPWWTKFPAAVAYAATVLAALGPVTAAINGCYDRDLQRRKTRDDISLRYMNLLLTRSESLDDRRAILTFLDKALSADNPSNVMLDTIRSELSSMKNADRLEAQLADSTNRVNELEGLVRAAQENEKQARSENEARTSAEVARLRSALRREQDMVKSLGEQVERERENVLVNDESSKAASEAPGGEGLEEALAAPGLSRSDRDSLRKAADYCRSFRGRYSIVSFDPNRHAVACTVFGETVFLDRSSFRPRIEVMNVRARPDSMEWGQRACSVLGGELLAHAGLGMGPYLCRLEGDVGVVVDGRQGL